MSARRIIEVSLLTGISIFLAFFVSNSFQAADLNLSEQASYFEWYPLVNQNHNAYLNWKDSPLVYLLSEIKPLTSIIVFLVGSFFLFAYLSKDRLLSVIIAANATLSQLFLNGNDSVVLQSISWVPLTLYFVIKSIQSESISKLSIKIVFLLSMMLSLSANHFALLLILCIFLAVFFLYKEDNSIYIRSKPLKLFAFFALLPTTLVLASVTEPNYPNYPPLSHVVPDDNIEGVILPFFGHSPKISIIERSWLKQTFSYLSIILALIYSVVIFGTKKHSSIEKGFNTSAGILLLLVALDSFFLEDVSQIMPLATISGLVPYQFSFPLSAIICPIIILYLYSSITKSKNLLLLALCPVLLCSVPYSKELSFELKPSSLQKDETLFRVSDYQKKLKVISPSFYILREQGLHILDNKELVQSAKFTPISNFEFEANASDNNTKEIENLISDNSRKTRWTTRKAKQEGNEYLEIRFKKQNELFGIELDPGKFRTDFPHGLSISYKTNCNNPSYKKIFKTEDWQGEIHYTKDGHPYYGKQNVVKVYFKEKIKAQCVLIKQISKSKYFDWSVAEVRLLLPN